ncbi:Ran binding protein-1 [Striga asiatica]|uniref:Ran binding protein-1 n=1 Tax=Striga asiatica TaxID=4170 RepID=A0A5A7PHD3_STRAF|nr:Ran binding protein-1 [Striga asiatica]
MATTTEPTALKKEEEEEEDDSKPSAEDEDTGAPIAPIVKLQEVSVATGEENEDIMLDLKAKLYRFDKEGSQWKERGVGTVKLLKHKKTGKVRLVMRQNKTLKICANHLVLPTLTMQEHQGNDKSCVWHAADFADGELKQETFCIRFPSVENCKSFKDMIEEITEFQAKVSGDSEEGTAAAGLLEKLSVGGNDKEDKESKEASSAAGEKKEDNKEKKEDDIEKPEAKDCRSVGLSRVVFFGYRVVQHDSIREQKCGNGGGCRMRQAPHISCEMGNRAFAHQQRDSCHGSCQDQKLASSRPFWSY